MFHQNFLSLFGDSCKQPNSLFSLIDSFETLQISNPLDKKRDQYLSTIRSQKRKHYLHAKRMGAFNLESLANELDNIEKGPNLQDYIDQCYHQTYSLDQFVEIIEALNSNDLFKQHFAVIGLRKLLCAESNPPIQQVLDAETLPKLIEFMKSEDQPRLLLEATWILSNLTSGTTKQTQMILDHGAIPVLIRLSKSSNREVREQIIWVLGNIAGDSSQFRDCLIHAGAVNPFIKIMEESLSAEDQALIKHGTWALSNLCRGKPLPPFYAVKNTIPIFARVIATQEDIDTLTDAAWALSFLSDGSSHEEKTQMVFDSGVVPYLVKLLDQSCISLVTPCLKTIGSILTGSIEVSNGVLEIPGVVEALFRFLSHSKKILRREAAWTISNIAAGSPQNLEYLLPACYLDQIFKSSLYEPVLEVRREVTWVLGNAMQTADDRQLKILFDRGILQHMSKIIQCKEDQKSQEVALEGVATIFKRKSFPEGYSPDVYRSILEQDPCVMEVIKEFSNSVKSEIVISAHEILDFDDNGVSDEKIGYQNETNWGL